MTDIVDLLRQANHAEALALIEKQLLKADTPSLKASLFNFRGFAYEQLRHLDKALIAYLQAEQLMPQEAEYANNIALAHIAAGNIQAARPYFEKVVQLKPDAQSYMNYALFLIECRDFFEAFLALEQANQRAPQWPVPQNALLGVIENLIYHHETASFLQERLKSSQESAFCLTALGIYYHLQSQDALAENYFKLALKKDHYDLNAYRHLIGILQSKKKFAESLNWALRFYEAEANFNTAKEVLASLQEPIPLSREHIAEIRTQLHTFLDKALEQQTYQNTDVHSITTSRALNFYHSYHGQEDRALQEKLARFYRLPIPDYKTSFVKRHHKPRVGILSFNMRDHSVMHLLSRAVEQVLNTPEFETFLYAVEESQKSKHDHVTDRLRQQAQHFRHLHIDYYQALEIISEDDLDILIYTDIGMDVFTYELALQRLARVQMTMSGHPVTTGMPTMDYFISSQYLETAESQKYYTEKLVPLNGLPDYEPVVVPERASRKSLGMPEAGNLYFCPMTLFKIHPDFDVVIGNILDRDSAAQVLFLENKPDLHVRLGHRFEQQLGRERRERIHFLSWADRQRFYQRLMAADVILDSFYFGGGNTAYQALGLGCPIVTLDLPWNKSRWTQTMYQLMGMPELIAKNRDDYVELSVSVANNKPWNQSLRQKILGANKVLFNNTTWSEELVAFCKTLTA